MSKGDRSKKGGGVAVDGEWLPLPVDFLRSRACAELSPHALKMLLDLMSQLGANGRGNGRIGAHADTMMARGWVSPSTICAALRELTEAGLIVRTLEPRKGRMALYAVTLWPMHCNSEGLDHGPGAWTVKGWRDGGRTVRADKPTPAQPATWKKVRPAPPEKRKSHNRSGSATTPCTTAAVPQATENTPCTTAAVPQTRDSTPNALPLRFTPLDTPSASTQEPEALPA